MQWEIVSNSFIIFYSFFFFVFTFLGVGIGTPTYRLGSGYHQQEDGKKAWNLTVEFLSAFDMETTKAHLANGEERKKLATSFRLDRELLQMGRLAGVGVSDSTRISNCNGLLTREYL